MSTQRIICKWGDFAVESHQVMCYGAHDRLKLILMAVNVYNIKMFLLAFLPIELDVI